MKYDGEERRREMDEADRGMLARIDERTMNILAELEKLATCERVDGLEGRLDRHIQSHDKKGNAIAQWAGIVIAGGLAALGLAKGQTP